MAKLSVAHFMCLFVVLSVLHLTRMCTACEKHKAVSHSDKRDDPCAEGIESKAGSGQQDEAEATPGAALRGAAESHEDLLAILKAADIESQATNIVETAMKHLTVQGLMPALKEIEDASREALRQVAAQVRSDDETEKDLGAVVTCLVRLISAVKAVRADVDNANAAWEELKESIRNMAQYEKGQPEESGKAAQAVLRFLEAEMWMMVKIELMHYSTHVLRSIVEQKDVREAISLVEGGEQSLSKLSAQLTL